MPLNIVRLRKRSDFLRLGARGRRAVFPGLILQAASWPQAALDRETTQKKAKTGWKHKPVPWPQHGFRLGFTASRKVGGAVERNRARRRLRCVARQVMPHQARPGYDYVIIARRALLQRSYDDLVQDLTQGLVQLARSRR